MKRVLGIIVLCLSITMAIGLPSSAQQDEEPPARDPTFEQAIHDRLEEISPDAVSLFQDATRQVDAGNLVAAKHGYERVLALAPGFPDAARRLSGVELALGDTEAALRLAELAYAGDPSPYNETALARALLGTEDRSRYEDALSHAKAAAAALPEEPAAQEVLLWAGMAVGDIDAIRRAGLSLRRIVPDHPLGRFFAGLVAAEEGRWLEAERELLLAEELGTPAETVQEALDGGIRTQARIRRWLRGAGYTAAGWLATFAVLFLAGAVLSALALSAARRVPSAARLEIGPGERLLRTVYRVVIAATSLYFYASIPLLILTVVAGTAGIFYLFLVVGQIPVRLAVIVAATALFTLYAIVRSVFARARQGEPGRPLSHDEAPRLWALSVEVAARLDTRPIDAIYVTPASEISVTERGRLWKKLRGTGQRCLIVGLGALPGMTQGQFRAILAHEYGHFAHRDTAGGNLARQVQISVDHMAFRLATGGLARWYNPAWLFVNGFIRIFWRITLGASRLQEVLADRYAATAYGAQSFASGLRHMIRQSLAFGLRVNDEVQAAQAQNRDLGNIYVLPDLSSEELVEQLEEKEAEVMSRPTTPYDSHLAPGERIALLEHLRGVDVPDENPEPAWDLLEDPEGLQLEMTGVVQTNVRRRQAQAR